MSTTLASLLPDVLGRCEENLPTDTPPGPIFWNLTGEVYPMMVDALFEAALMTGVVQQSNVTVTLQPGITYFGLQQSSVGYGQGGFGEGGYGGTIGVPQGTIAALRLRAPYSIRKTSLKALDDYQPNWQNATPGTQIQAWFPLGISGFGIWPQLSNEAEVVMDFLVSPVNVPRPYVGTIPIPLQTEFCDLVSQYAAAMLRAKEGGAEAEEADVTFQDFMGRMKQLSLFQSRLDSLIYSSAFGGQSRPSVREVV